jgi:hypothetical protein
MADDDPGEDDLGGDAEARTSGDLGGQDSGDPIAFERAAALGNEPQGVNFTPRYKIS